MIKGIYAIAIAMLLGSIGGAIIFAKTTIAVKMLDRTVQVKGLAEKKVKADSAIWVIPINSTNDNLITAQTKVDGDTIKIINFLKQFNINENEISKRSIRVFDKLAQRYYNENNAPRYFIESEIVVKTLNIDAVIKANQNINQLINQNITIAYEEYKFNGPKFLFTKINNIKPEMLAEATKQARKAAEEFALNSNSKIGKIKRASQGVFSILSPEVMQSSDNNSYGSNEAYFDEKVIRVLTSVEYYLES